MLIKRDCAVIPKVAADEDCGQLAPFRRAQTAAAQMIVRDQIDFAVGHERELFQAKENGDLRQSGEGIRIVGAQALGHGHSIHKDAFSAVAGC